VALSADALDASAGITRISFGGVSKARRTPMLRGTVRWRAHLADHQPDAGVNPFRKQCWRFHNCDKVVP
jgi:hypothetical protein